MQNTDTSLVSLMCVIELSFGEKKTAPCILQESLPARLWKKPPFVK